MYLSCQKNKTHFGAWCFVTLPSLDIKKTLVGGKVIEKVLVYEVQTVPVKGEYG